MSSNNPQASPDATANPAPVSEPVMAEDIGTSEAQKSLMSDLLDPKPSNSLEAEQPPAAPASVTPEAEVTPPAATPSADAPAPATSPVPPEPSATVVPVVPSQPVALDPAAENARLQEMNAALIAQLNAMASGQGITIPPPQAQAPVTPAPAQAPQVPAAAPVTQVAATAPFVTAEQFEEALRDPAKFNEVLLSVYNRAQADAINKVAPIAVNIVQQERALVRFHDEFYNQNPDLEVWKPYIGAYVTQYLQVNPTASLETASAEAAKEVRARFKLAVQAAPASATPSAAPAAPTTRRPAFAPGTSARQPAPALSGQKKHMADVMGG